MRFLDRYMYERQSERSEGSYDLFDHAEPLTGLCRVSVIDDLIDEFAEIVKRQYGLEELHDPSRVSEVRRKIS